MSRMHAETFDVLRHIEVHGPRTRPELSKGLRQADKDVVKRLANLMMLGYVAMDETTRPASFTLTGKARLKLADRTATYAPAPPREPKPMPKKERVAEEPALSATKARQIERRSMPADHVFTRRTSTVIGGALTAPYRATEFNPSPRSGANTAFELPSRMGDQLHYRDGRVTDLDGNPLS